MTLAKVAGDQRLTLLAGGAAVARRGNRARASRRRWLPSCSRRSPATSSPPSDDTGAYTAQLKEIQSPETIPDAAAQELSDQLAGDARADVAGEFTEILRQRFPVEIQREALDRMF